MLKATGIRFKLRLKFRWIFSPEIFVKCVSAVITISPDLCSSILVVRL
jgi:hypothetical protein